MPFDPAKLGDRVRIVPPTPPEPERGPRRIHLHIEIKIVPPPPPPAPAWRPRSGVPHMLVQALLVALILAALIGR